MKKEYKFYEGYLELHDHHTLWNINSNTDLDMDEYGFEVQSAIEKMQKHFKDLEVLCLGRSGRHICVADTPVNRRRLKQLTDYAVELEKDIIETLNWRG